MLMLKGIKTAAAKVVFAEVVSSMRKHSYHSLYRNRAISPPSEIARSLFSHGSAQQYSRSRNNVVRATTVNKPHRVMRAFVSVFLIVPKPNVLKLLPALAGILFLWGGFSSLANAGTKYIIVP